MKQTVNYDEQEIAETIQQLTKAIKLIKDIDNGVDMENKGYAYAAGYSSVIMMKTVDLLRTTFSNVI
mgnify:FL=1|tara:strand:- start:155 stop:355 length:201 start_codon:yes stop_codon:yes gene_type:complete